MTTEENSLQALRERVLKRVELQPEAFHPAGNPDSSDEPAKGSNADLLNRIEWLEKEVAEGRRNLIHVAELVGRLADLAGGSRGTVSGSAGSAGSAGGAGGRGGGWHNMSNIYDTYPNDYERKILFGQKDYTAFGRLTGASEF